jgi:hypothetical protein
MPWLLGRGFSRSDGTVRTVPAARTYEKVRLGAYVFLTCSEN